MKSEKIADGKIGTDPLVSIAEKAIFAKNNEGLLIGLTGELSE